MSYDIVLCMIIIIMRERNLLSKGSKVFQTGLIFYSTCFEMNLLGNVHEIIVIIIIAHKIDSNF